MSNSEIDKLIDRIPKENKYMVTTQEVVNYIYMLEQRINKAVEYVKECYTQPPNIENFMHEGEMNYLLNILNGRSDE